MPETFGPFGPSEYLTRPEVEALLESRKSRLIIGKWYEEMEVLCLDCGERRAQFRRVRGSSVTLVCKCGSVFCGSFGRGAFHVGIWLGRQYQELLDAQFPTVDRKKLARLVRKIRRGFRNSSRASR